MNKQIFAICPNCKKQISALRQNFFDLNFSQDIIDSFLNRSYFNLKCSFCNKEITVLDRVETINTNKKYFVFFDQDPTFIMDKLKNDFLFKEQIKNYKIRFTNNVDDFVEKLSIFENEFRDTDIEVIKSYIVFNVLKKLNRKIKIIRFMGLCDNDHDAFFMIEDTENKREVIRFPLVHFLNKIKNYINDDFGNKIVVNMDQAFKYVLNDNNLRKIFKIDIKNKD